MNSANYNGKKKKTAEIKDDDDDAVDALLRAAQDDVLLKLSVNSHIARATSSSPLDPDLDSRFQALKSNQPKSKSKSNLDASKERTITEKKNPERFLPQVAESDDLFARFTTLKGSLPSHSSEVRQQQQQQLENDGGEECDEVEKLIKWAIDAARLDPSPPSDSDNDEEGKDDDDDDDDDVDSDGEGVDHRKIDAARAGTKSEK